MHGARACGVHVVRDDSGGEAVRVVLAALPRDGPRFEVRQMPGDATGADFQGLMQPSATGFGVARVRAPSPWEARQLRGLGSQVACA